MAWFKKKDKVVDLGKKYKERQAAQRQAAQQMNSQTQTSTASQTPSSSNSASNASAGFGIFDSDSTSTDSSSDFVNISDTMEGRRKRLAKRIMEMTSKMENLSNQVYHLQQRIEVLERKLDVGRY